MIVIFLSSLFFEYKIYSCITSISANWFCGSLCLSGRCLHCLYKWLSTKLSLQIACPFMLETSNIYISTIDFNSVKTPFKDLIWTFNVCKLQGTFFKFFSLWLRQLSVQIPIWKEYSKLTTHTQLTASH